MKPVRLSRGARTEIEDGVEYYNNAQEGLGDEFQDEIEQALDLIGKQPKAFSPYSNGYRKRVLDWFPYSIFSFEYPAYVWIAAVHHGSRQPDTWMDRSPDGDSD